MAKVGSYIRAGVLTPGSPVALNTSFNAATTAIALDRGAAAFAGHLGAMYVFLNTVAGGATKITVRLTRDSAGDECIVPDTEATIATGVTTAADGSIAVKIDIPWVSGTSDNVYPFYKTDAGTANMVSTIVTWRE